MSLPPATISPPQATGGTGRGSASGSAVDAAKSPMSSPKFKVDIWHNILWSRYKAAIFSSLSKQLPFGAIRSVRVFQVAESEGNRINLSDVDYSVHDYEMTLVFKGLLEDVPRGRMIHRLAMEVWRSDADLFVLCGYHRIEYWIQLLVGRINGKKVAFFCDATAYDNPPTMMKGIAKSIIFRLTHGVFCYGERSRAYALGFGTPSGRIFQRVQACTLPADYSPASALADRLAVDPGRPEYLYVGRLSPEKDLGTLLEAFARVHRALPDARMTVVGSGPERDALAGRVRRLGIGEAVEFAGAKSGSDLYRFYSRATCLVLPSVSEPWGLVVNEALSFGCPVIVSHRCGCVPELVVDGETGYVFEAGDVDDLTRRMLAAAADFGDRSAAAERCLAQIAPYTPAAAAAQLLRGCSVLLGAPA